MKCPFCNTENPEGSMFCKGCGKKMAGESSVPVTDAATPIFCPNCGKKFVAGETFCDECGTNLAEAIGNNGAAKSVSKLKMPVNGKTMAIAVGAIAVIAVGAFAVSKMSGGSSSSSDVEKHLVYFVEDSMMLADLTALKKEPLQITESMGDICVGMKYNHFLTKDEKYAYFMENHDGYEYDLFRVPVSKIGKKDATEKIDSRVANFTILDNNNVIYKRNDSWCYYDGKETRKFGRGVQDYRIDKEVKNICWSEPDEKGGLVYYYQDLAQKKDKIELGDGITSFYASKGLNKFYALKDDKLVELSKAGQDTTIARNVYSIVSMDADAGSIYYTKEELHTVPYSDLVYDDANRMGANVRAALERNMYDYTTYSLYHYNNGKETKITEDMRNVVRSQNGKFCLYYEYPSQEEMKVGYSKVINASSENELREELTEQISLCLTTSAKNDKIIVSCEGVINESIYDEDTETLYYVDYDTDSGEGIVYSMPVSGNKAGIVTACSDEGEDIDLISTCKDGVYYKMNGDQYGADLYLNRKQLADEVWSVAKLNDNGELMYNGENNNDGTFVLKTYDGKTSKEVQDGVNYASGSEDGTIVFMVDYDSNRREGSLMYYNGKKVIEIDDEASGFAVRRDSHNVR